MARQLNTVLFSIAAHVIGIFFLVVIPLVAIDYLPDVPSMVKYIEVAKPEPIEPPAPRTAPASATSVPDPGPPTSAPDDIKPEIERPPTSFASPDAVPGSIDFGGKNPPMMSTPPPAPPRDTPAEPIRPGGKVKEPARIGYVAPVYPQLAISARVAGTVIIEAIIGTDGLVRDARVIRSIPLLDAAALAAVKQWRYTPTLLNGVPVPVVMTVTVHFTLQDAALPRL
jgi:protein TonB